MLASTFFHTQSIDAFGPNHELWQCLKPGDSLGIWACAQHAGWSCTVDWATLFVWKYYEP